MEHSTWPRPYGASVPDVSVSVRLTVYYHSDIFYSQHNNCLHVPFSMVWTTASYLDDSPLATLSFTRVNSISSIWKQFSTNRCFICSTLPVFRRSWSGIVVTWRISVKSVICSLKNMRWEMTWHSSKSVRCVISTSSNLWPNYLESLSNATAWVGRGAWTKVYK